MRAAWCDRNLIKSPVYYTIATSEKIMQRELKRLKVPDKFEHVSSGSDATTQSFTDETGKQISIVCFYDHKSNPDLLNLSLIVHEAVHIWQKIRDSMGEKEPSAEFEAYSVQMISQELFLEFARQTKKRGRK